MRISSIPDGPFRRRLERVASALKDTALDAMVVLDRVNIVYLTGFKSTYAILVVDQRDVHLITDSRYGEAAEKQLPWLTVKVLPGKQVTEYLQDFFRGRGYDNVGFEEAIRVEQMDTLDKWLSGAHLVRAGKILKNLRMVKDATELSIIRRAVALADRMMDHVATEIIRPGVTEREVSRRVRFASEELGGEGESFPNIIASGPNSSIPHHHPGDRVLHRGDVVTVDLGAIVDGYCSDLTRNFFLGPLSSELERVYTTVLEANNAAIAAIRPGMTGPQADAVARDIINAAGFGAYFGHGLGHGVGLEIHEAPRLSPLADDTPLAAGHIITIEPGVYIPGLGGVRIEDYAVVTEGGAEVLSRYPKDIAVLEF